MFFALSDPAFICTTLTRIARPPPAALPA